MTEKKPKRSKAEIEAGRLERKGKREERKARRYANAAPLFENVGIVQGTTPRDMSDMDDMKQSVRYIKASGCQTRRTLTRLSRVTSDKPVEYETIEEQAGFNDWSRSWWDQAVPNYPSKQKANPVMKTRSTGIREAFVKARARVKGFQAPPHP